MLSVLLFFALAIFSDSRMPNGYSDYYARHKLWPSTWYIGDNHQGIFTNESFSQYLSSCYYNATFYVYVNQPCDIFVQNNWNITCSGLLFVSHDDEAIFMLFRGTHGNGEIQEEENFLNLTDTFPGGGTVSHYYYNALQVIWNSGMRDAFFAAKNANPTYELWVTGFSMGASLASLAAPYVSAMGYLPPESIKMVSFEGLRVGHQDFADRYTKLVPYSYRVTHHYDIVPHLIAMNPYFHVKNEVWYPNEDMGPGAPYIECDEQESLNCSNSVPKNLWTWNDHSAFNDNHTDCAKTTPSPFFFF